MIEDFRAAPSNAERGEKFERLMVDYFFLDPTLAVEYDEVKRWPDWDHAENTHDSGIDLVARNKDTGEWTAIQCKFYDPKHTLAKADIDSFFTASGKAWDGVTFTNRIIISTTDRWSSQAETALENQQIPVQRIGLADIAESPIDWMLESKQGLEFKLKKAVRYSLRPHQKDAIAAIREGFVTHDRGKWISACGTGKTFTSLKLAEQLAAENGGQLKVLFLAPSISLVSQTLREWMAQTQTDIRPFVVCSDTKAGRQAEDITTHDIPLPTTDAARLASEMAKIGRRGRQMTVVFSTYQSIDVVAQAQRQSNQAFDLILCDEAHRTTGVTLTGDTAESAFVKVHDNTYLPAAKRLYMTATPRIYGEDVKRKADEASAVLTSMDDETAYGPEFHRLGFGEAVERNLLSDYKVMILVVEGDAIATHLQAAMANDDRELSLDDAAKIVGCWNGLAKRTTDHDFGLNPTPMKRAVAFCRDIKASKGFAGAFPEVVETLVQDADGPTCDVEHVDGTMNALERADRLAWLKAPIPEGECRVLSNARCLSEGVDVPALDAVLFLHPRNSLVDVVQSVGRVMRRSDGKDYGYVILPVAIPAGLAPEEALKDNKRFKVVWDVLNALRSHDDRFNAMINSIDLDKNTKGKIILDVIGTGGPTDDAEGKPLKTSDGGVQLPLFDLGHWRDSILARIVKKVGDREYWDQWADSVVDIAANQRARIKAILDAGDPAVTAEFDTFLDGLKANLNDSINADDAANMLSQHLITKPVFDALFEHDSFAAHNPVSITMQKMVDALAGHGLDAETASLEKFYDSVRKRASQIETAAGRQTVIHELYENFFKKAFPKQAASFGVVYTPVEIVDFILRAADDVCRQEFGYGLTDEGVHILDPFTGTGTFIVRLLESGIIRPEDLARKYTSELWANEIMLLAYYIACVNIETTYQAIIRQHLKDITDAADTLGSDLVEVGGHADVPFPEPVEGSTAPIDVPYVPFPGATLTDTFQITEEGDRADTSLIPVNNDRIEAQLAAPIKVIVGNPPYSAGQGSANDNNANLKYATLDARIAETYAARSTATLKNSLYDSYVRAFRWATDRIGGHGVIAFVSNNGWVDGNTADGIRKTFQTEFSEIYVYNLRGNQRTAGETSRQEGGKVFGSGARTGVAILIAVKRLTTSHTPARVHYLGVPDYQTADEKLARINATTLDSTAWTTLNPNRAGDWLHQRSTSFIGFPAITLRGDESEEAHFGWSSSGIQTNRDSWCYSYSRDAVDTNMRRMIEFYATQASTSRGAGGSLDLDPTRISWTDRLIADALKGKQHSFDAEAIRNGLYRPFTKQAVYFDPSMVHRVYQQGRFFPTPNHANVGITVIDSGARAPFSVLMAGLLPDSKMYVDAAQFFPRWTYEKASDPSTGSGHEQGSLLETTSTGSAGGDVDEWGYRRVDNITDGIQALYRERFGASVTKDDVFYYVYGVLHSEQYRITFAADLKRMLPRIPLAATASDFFAFGNAGRKLADLHVNYETVEPYPLHEQAPAFGDPFETFRVTKMRWADKTTKKAIVYNALVTLGDIPAEAHRYMLGSRSALEWLIDRYQVKTDKASGIVNDPNDWCREHNDPRYIVDLIKRVTRVSIDTMKIVDSLPHLPL
ncbi:DEAD/DEAH box helicase [Propioniciclava tarda]|nr:type ISP restriction/modification enzyme [Propioniciclava tarda]